MDDSGTVVVAATNARLASVAVGLSLVTESAVAYGRSASSMVSVCQSRHALSTGASAAHHESRLLRIAPRPVLKA